jgi:hypothetical protein
MAKPGPKGPIATSFKPGQSGNPGSKPKDPEARAKQSYLRDLCREHVPEAVDALMEALRSGTERSVRAAEVLCAYGYGRPVQTSIVRRVTDFGELDDDELLALAQAAAADDGEAVEISDEEGGGDRVH